MPVIIQVIYADGTTEDMKFPAEIWRFDNTTFSKVIKTDKVIDQIILDPYLETADVDRDNNHYPKRNEASRFETFKRNFNRRRGAEGENPMQRANRVKVIRP